MQVMVMMMTLADPYPMHDISQLPVFQISHTSQLVLYFTGNPIR